RDGRSGRRLAPPGRVLARAVLPGVRARRLRAGPARRRSRGATGRSGGVQRSLADAALRPLLPRPPAGPRAHRRRPPGGGQVATALADLAQRYDALWLLETDMGHADPTGFVPRWLARYA